MREKGRESIVRLAVLLDGAGVSDVRGSSLEKSGDVISTFQPEKGAGDGCLCVLTGCSGGESFARTNWSFSFEDSPFRWARRIGILPDQFNDKTGLRNWVIRETHRRFISSGRLPAAEIPLSHLPALEINEDFLPEKEELLMKQIAKQNGKDPDQVFFFQSVNFQGLRKVFEKAADKVKNAAAAAVFCRLKLKEPKKAGSELAENLSFFEQRVKDAKKDFQAAVFSFRDFSPVKNVYDLHGCLDRLHVKSPRDYLCVSDSCLARFWFHRPGKEARIRVTAALEDSGAGLVLDRNEFEKQVPGLDPDKHWGDVFFLAHPGSVFSSSHRSFLPPYSADWLQKDEQGFILTRKTSILKSSEDLFRFVSG